MKRIISILLSALMVMAIIPVSVLMVSAEGETVELYHNDFETAMNPNGGTQSSCERVDYNTTYGKAMKVYGGGRWDEPVTLNNATGAITVVARVYTNNFVNQTSLGINGVQVVHSGGDKVLKIGAVKGTAVKEFRELIITVVIPDLSTGTANVTVTNADGSYPATGTAELGAISEKLDLYVVAGNNSMTVLDVKVSQAVAFEPEDPETPEETKDPVISKVFYHNDFETAMNPNGGTQLSCERVDYSETEGKAMKVWGGGRWDEPVSLNGYTGAVTVVAKVYTNNFVNQTSLGINGVQVVHSGGDKVLKIGAVKGTAVKEFRELIITVVIPDLSTGTANVTVTNADGSYPATGTAELGAISDTLNLYVDAGNNSMQVLDIKVYNDMVSVTGTQKTTVDAEGKYNVRFVTAVQDISNISVGAVGFDITATYGEGESKTWTGKETNVVYNALTVKYGTDVVTAEEIGGAYVTAMAITGIPSDVGAVVFTVKPYVVINNVKYYGNTVTVTIDPAA